MTSPDRHPVRCGQADEIIRRLMSCWAVGDRVPVEHFLLEQPALAADPATLLELVLLESTLREDLGEQPTLSELVLRFPSLAKPLELQVALRDGLRRTTNPPQQVGGPWAQFSISGYEIGRLIGRGGMATVYEARQLNLNRPVALKMLSGGPFSDAQQHARLKTEAEAVARLQHPNVVQIYEVGMQDGHPFLILELVGGGTLADKLRAGPISPLAAAELIETLSRAVHAVHERGIVHRDIKPANVLFTRPTDDNTPGTPKLSDFGLAKLADQNGHATHTGDILGTPAYMAPEQVAGGRDVGSTIDVYGLGAILYESLSGHPPFRGRNVAEALLHVSQHDPAPMSRLQPGVPRDVETICLKCLEKNPKRRYQTAAELADDLARFRRGEPVLARPLGPAGQLWKMARRRPLVACLLLSLFTAVTGGLIGVTWKWREADRRADGETREREKAEINLYRSRVSQAASLWQSNNLGAARELLSACIPAPGQPDLRGWEWNYLRRLLEPEVATITLQAWVREIAVSPDGREFAAACGTPASNNMTSSSGELVVFDFHTRSPIWRFGERETVAVAYSPDGRFLASATTSGTVRVFDRATRRERFVWEEGAGQIGLRFHPNNTCLAAVLSGPSKCRVVIRELGGGAEVAVRRIGDLKGPYPEPAYSPDGRWVVTARPGEKLELWNPLTNQKQDAGEPNTQAAAFLGVDHLVTAGDGSGAIWDLAIPNGEPRRLFGHTGMVCAVAVNGTGTSLATGGTDHTVRLWDVKTARETLVLRGHTWTVQSVAFTPDGRHVVSGGQDGCIKIWDVTQDPQGRVLRSAGWVNAIAFTPDGRFRRASSGSKFGDGKILTWLVADGRPAGDATLTGVTSELSWPRCYAEFYPGGDRVVSIDDRDPQVVKSWDAETGRVCSTFRGHTARVRAVAVSEDGRWVASAAWDDWAQRPVTEVRLWDAGSGLAGPAIDLPHLRVFTLAISPDRRRLAVGGFRDGLGGLVSTVSIWDIENTKQIGEATGHADNVTKVTFSPDSRRVASVGFGNQLFLIDAGTGRVIYRTATVRSPTCVTYHPSGHRLAVIGYEGAVSLVDSEDGKETFRLAGLIGNWKGDLASDARVRFSADGNWLASTNWDGSLNIWDGRSLSAAGR